ncbi:MAG: hypothetical protein LUO93_09140 [Methanomicrobiales archaeon]|nr:hypothetical protein [Methanomicrobiales archaeon]
MNIHRTVSMIIVALGVLGLLISPSLAATIDSGSTSTSNQVAVTTVNVDPAVLMRGDTGIVTLTVKNTGTQMVSIKGADFYAKELTTLNYQTYATTVNLGPGDSTEFAFTIRADAPDGIYYPRFYLNMGTDSYRYYVPVKVESTTIDVSVIDRPDSYTKGVKDTITLVIGNPRESTLSGVTVTPQGVGIETTQTKVFIGDLEPGKSAQVVIEATPSQEGDLNFLVEYRNGINKHIESIAIPVTFAGDKLAAQLFINSIEISGSTGGYSLSADVTNAGLSDARSIVVTAGSPAQAIDPNPVYIIGSLEPDDFSSFDLTFTAPPGSASVPLLIQYKDADGNTFEQTYTVNLRSAGTISQNSSNGSAASYPNTVVRRNGGGLFPGFGSGIGQIPFLELGLISVAAIVLVVAWRKGVLGKIKTRIRK